MKKERIYQNLRAKMEEISLLPPQTLGPLTAPYKVLASYLKVYPWRLFVLGAFLAAFFLYFFLGEAIVYLASILQHGF